MTITIHTTRQDELTFASATINDFFFEECMGCGRNTQEIVEDQGCSFEELDNESRRTIEGNWYCHIDCFRDSRG